MAVQTSNIIALDFGKKRGAKEEGKIFKRKKRSLNQKEGDREKRAKSPKTPCLPRDPIGCPEKDLDRLLSSCLSVGTKLNPLVNRHPSQQQPGAKGSTNICFWPQNMFVQAIAVTSTALTAAGAISSRDYVIA